MKALISVIVPVYKVEKYLNKCLDSIIFQTYKNIEILLIDDGSPDNCPKICDYYVQKDKRIRELEERNAQLEMENDLLKKLRALVQQRTQQQNKKK